MKRYLINEIFYSIQGEGARAGTANVFVRFSKCNLRCCVAVDGFDCDTDFDTGTWYTAVELAAEARRVGGNCDWVIFTGGEPALQLDTELINTLGMFGYHFAIETNGTRALPDGIDWVCVSPKPSGQVVLTEADEVKHVLSAGMAPPADEIRTANRLVSPAFDGDAIVPGALEWCIDFVRRNPSWRLSVQQHKAWGVR